MFFFFFNYDESQIIKKCLDIYFYNKMGTNEYCDVSELFSDKINKVSLIKSFGINYKELHNLYKKNYPKSKDDLHILSKIYIDRMENIINPNEAFAILFWSFKIFKKNMKFEDHTDEIMDNLLSYLKNSFTEPNYKRTDTIIYSDKVETKIITCISDFLSVLNTLPQQKELFYRGHSMVSYKLKPSILRSEKLSKNENHIYQELLINCPNDFKNATHHIDYLVKMQHYGLPTRLLDITRNPLVALYFSCCSNQKNIGEVLIFSPPKEKIKYENSDTVAMLSSLPLFSYEDRIDIMDYLNGIKVNENVINRFIHELQTEKPGFINRIKKQDIDSCLVVLPKKDNNRIMKQDGAFILCGINSHPEEKINEELRLNCNNKMVVFLVKNKQKILNELDLLSINKSTLFPEIDSVSEYIKNKYII